MMNPARAVCAHAVRTEYIFKLTNFTKDIERNCPAFPSMPLCDLCFERGGLRGGVADAFMEHCRMTGPYRSGPSTIWAVVLNVGRARGGRGERFQAIDELWSSPLCRPAFALRRALDEVASRMPSIGFTSWGGCSGVSGIPITLMLQRDTGLPPHIKFLDTLVGLLLDGVGPLLGNARIYLRLVERFIFPYDFRFEGADAVVLLRNRFHPTKRPFIGLPQVLCAAHSLTKDLRGI